MKPKISYIKKYNSNGYIYNQRIRIDNKLFELLRDIVHSEISMKYPRKKEYVFTSSGEIYLKPLSFDIHNKVYFLNSTQLRFINLFLKLNLKDRNTYLVVKN